MSGSHYKPSDKEKYTSKDDKGVITIKPRGLNVVWGADERYWKIDTKNDNSDAELVQVCWLEVTGEIPVNDNYLKPKQEYKLIFNVELKPDAFGWKESPVQFMVKPGKGRKWKRCYLGSSQKNTNKLQDPFQAPADDKEIGFKFQVADGAKTVSFGMFEIWKGTWKGGLIIKSVQVEPVN
ncbi:Phloem protein 2-like protein [Dioscorea alata]|uniref:Phloem protein 2-like protein n=1 Tax=Dioscorea alata TaxID=55571 RepID=A0ACB7U2C9_DIOAL|nr:Phloem protein 2-like protein [Dioscorea alata]